MPRKITIFDDFYLIITRGEIEGVVSGSSETIVDVNRGGFGGRGDREEAGGFDQRTLVETDFVATSQEGNKVGGGDDDERNSQEKREAFFVRGWGWHIYEYYT